MWMVRSVAVVLAAVSLLAVGGAAQTPACASKLVPCAPYMNGTTTPPDTCCGPLKETVRNELRCLCAIYASPEIFKAFNINVTDALRLAQRCGIDSYANQCSSLSPANSPPGPPGGNNKNAGYRTTSVSLPGLMSLFLILWSVFA